MRSITKALTLDDVLLVPAHSTVLPRDVSLATRVTRSIALPWFSPDEISTFPSSVIGVAILQLKSVT